MLQISGLDVHLGHVQVLSDVELAVPSGQMCGLIGRNGAGKTTLIRTVAGSLRPSGGSMMFDEVDLAKRPPHHRARLGIGVMPEDRRLVPELTAEENIMLPVWATRASEAQKRLDWIYELMPEVREFRHRGALQLSGGQQKFVAFARALMAGTQLLLLDEPSEGIAPAFVLRMVEILSDLKSAGQSVLLAESNDAHIAHILDATFVIERGSIVETR